MMVLPSFAYAVTTKVVILEDIFESKTHKINFQTKQIRLDKLCSNLSEQNQVLTSIGNPKVNT